MTFFSQIWKVNHYSRVDRVTVHTTGFHWENEMIVSTSLPVKMHTQSPLFEKSNRSILAHTFINHDFINQKGLCTIFLHSNIKFSAYFSQTESFTSRRFHRRKVFARIENFNFTDRTFVNDHEWKHFLINCFKILNFLQKTIEKNLSRIPIVLLTRQKLSRNRVKNSSM